MLNLDAAYSRLLWTARSVGLTIEPVSKGGIALCLVTVAVLAHVMWGDCKDAMLTLQESTAGLAFVGLGLTLMIVGLVAFVWRIVLVIKYKPHAACSDGELPVCTVIIPAYNEGSHVLSAIRSVIASDYPAGKLQVIAIDDGSVDDTWSWLRKAAEEFPGRLEIYGLPRNRGKKHALREGFLLSRGEVLVSVDSDSVVEKQALRRLVSPFVRDGRVGAVAGNIRVLNINEGLIPRMLEVSFAFSFDFVRASQSVLGAVFCTPGALSAYRRGPLMKVLNEWSRQTFGGKPSKIGEDRALTNLLLREGSHVSFQNDAIAFTKVPVHYAGLCKMLIRWARSNVRELINMNAFMFTKFRQTSLAGPKINYILEWVDMSIVQLMMIGTIACLLWRPGTSVTQVLIGSAMAALVPAAFYAIKYRNTNGLWAFPYSVFWLLALSWITPYSILTVSRDGWLTRTIRKPAPAATPARASQRLLPQGMAGTAA
jgi:hyaluronan synthase